MVTAKTQYSLKGAKGILREHLCVGDYYDEGQRVAGEWMGKGAERLGYVGKVGPMISSGCAEMNIQYRPDIDATVEHNTD